MSSVATRDQAQAWHAVIRYLMSDNGSEVVSARGTYSREAYGPFTLTVLYPEMGLVGSSARQFNHAISALEGMSLIGQTSVPELQTRRVKALESYQSGSVFRGAYGPRAEGVLDDVVALLKRDPESRQAVVSLFDSHRDLGRWTAESKSGDVPCTLSIQFLIRRGHLNMWVAMRSNDAWYGLPYDLGQFSLLQAAIASALDVGMGAYTHTAGSMHIYEANWGDASVVAQTGEPRLLGPDTGLVSGFMGHDFPEIASRARAILVGNLDGPLTELESYLVERVGPLS